MCKIQTNTNACDVSYLCNSQEYVSAEQSAENIRKSSLLLRLEPIYDIANAKNFNNHDKWINK